ncbi:1-deoxy-D-xylulose 5-phosphate synthase [Lachnospiraceae bacterium KM106-2]|nr:1-deoxy-D-xylulose 5-phosphate synthase [Lachnospiraceae bacterium KM106-2]
MNHILDKVDQLKDLKGLNQEELTTLAEEIRNVLIKKVSQTGGHFGPNLGMVEATIAMHYVFNSPKDKIVYDVSHQSYTHKILTGRKNAFLNPEEYDSITGYTEPGESEHDHFIVGHTSTSISLACGLAKARDVKGDTENIIAVIGDGSLSGGEAYEGLNNAAESGRNIIIVVNDNDMSIAPNYGGIYRNLKLLRDSNGTADNNLFKALGFDYRFVEQGNDVTSLIEAFEKVKDINHPVIVHIHTLKGKGYPDAEVNKEAYHWVSPFNPETKELLHPVGAKETYGSITEQFLMEKAKEEKRLVAITAATPGVVNLKNFREKYKEQYLDVGIAEEHAVALASGMASQGAKPVLGLMSSFAQRTYDQLSQDLAINNNPALLLIYGGCISGADVTHLGLFDIPLISNIPNIVYLAPTNKQEYIAMLEWGLKQEDHPVAIRVPSTEVFTTDDEIEADFEPLNKFQVTHKGSKVAILGLGNFYHLGMNVKTRLEKEGIDATLINPRFITGVDEALLTQLEQDHELVITLEDGILDGGFGEKIARFYSDRPMKTLCFGAKKEFTDKVPLSELYERYHLTEEWIVSDIKNRL